MPRRRPVSLVKRRLAPVPAVVELARDLLARARSGELRSLAYAGETRNHHLTSAFVIENGASKAPSYLAMSQLLRRLEMPEVEVLADLHGIGD